VFLFINDKNFFMATMTTAPATGASSKGKRIAGYVISYICILFLLFDAVTKIIQEHHTVEASQHTGWPVETLTPIGIVLLVCTVLYIIRRTAVFGAVLLTAWLGGGTAMNVRAGFPWWFSVVFGILVWLGLGLRDPRVRNLFAGK
jgi:hypothetical protein